MFESKGRDGRKTCQIYPSLFYKTLAIFKMD